MTCWIVRAAAPALFTILLGASAATAGDATVQVHHGSVELAGHTVVADDGSFESHGLDQDEKWFHTFQKGVHPYHVKQHPDVKGKVTVE